MTPGSVRQVSAPAPACKRASPGCFLPPAARRETGDAVRPSHRGGTCVRGDSPAPMKEGPEVPAAPTENEAASPGSAARSQAAGRRDACPPEGWSSAGRRLRPGAKRSCGARPPEHTPVSLDGGRAGGRQARRRGRCRRTPGADTEGGVSCWELGFLRL